MVERTSRLRLIIESVGDREAVRELNRLETQSRRTADSTDRLQNNFRTGQRGSQQYGAALGRLTARMTAIGGAAAGAAAAIGTISALRVSADFERQMSAVLAITQATQTEFEALGETARALGASTEFSATQAAEGLEFLARAGFSANQAIEALPATLDLAISGSLGLGRAADIASNVLSGFILQAEESGRVADVLALGAASANTTVEQLGVALAPVAPIAAGLNVSLEETVAAIGRLSDAGLQGTVAGTGFRRVLSELASPSEELTALLDGVSLEADGFIAVMEQLATQSISTGDAIELFGDRGGPAFAVLIEQFRRLDQDGVSALENYTTQLSRADGFARRTAETLSDNLTGATRSASSAFSELQIIVGDSGGLEATTEIVERLTDALQSNAARDFAEGVGEGLQSATNIAIGLLATLEDINRLIPNFGDGDSDDADFVRRSFLPAPVRVGLDTVGALGQRGEIANAEREAREALDETTAALGRQQEALRASADGFDQLLTALDDGVQEVFLVGEAVTDIEALAAAFQTSGDAAEDASDQIEGVAEASDRAGDAIRELIQRDLERARALRDAARVSPQAVVELQFQFDIEDAIREAEADFAEAGLVFDAAIAADIAETFNVNRLREQLVEAAEEAGEALQRLIEEAADDLRSVSDDVAQDRRSFADQSIDSIRGLDPRDRQERRQLELLLERLREDLVRALQDGGAQTPEQQRELEIDREQIRTIEEALDRTAGAFDASTDRLINDFNAAVSGIGDIGFSANNIRELLRDDDITGGERVGGILSEVSGALGGAADALSGILPGLSGTLNAIVPGLGSIGQIVSLFSGLFGNPSNFSGFARLDPNTNQIDRTARRDDSQQSFDNQDRAVELLTEASRVTERIRDAAGGLFTRNIQVELGSRDAIGVGFEGFTQPGLVTDRPEAALREIFNLSLSVLEGANDDVAAFIETLVNGTRPLEQIASVIDVLAQAAETGDERITRYALAVAESGLNADEIANGINSISAALALAEEPLSGVLGQLQQLDDAAQPAIDALAAAGQSFDDITAVVSDAGRAIAEGVLEENEDFLLRSRSTVLADYRQVLDEIEQRQQEAVELFSRGFITQGEFESLRLGNATRADAFFDDLSPEELEELGDFLDILGESSDNATVRLAQLVGGIEDVADGSEETLNRLQRQADDLLSQADALGRTRQSILDEFSPLSRADQIGDIRGELSGILFDIQRPSAEPEFIRDQAARANELARLGIDLLESEFGGLGGFADGRDFIVDIIGQIERLARDEGNELLSAVEAQNELVAISQEILDAIGSPDQSEDLLQQILDAGQITNDRLRELVEAYLETIETQSTVTITPEQAQEEVERFFGGAGQNGLTATPDSPDDPIQRVEDIIAPALRRLTDEQGSSEVTQLLGSILTELQDNNDLQRAANGG